MAKRDIVFHNSGDLTTALGVDETRSRAIELRINELIERNASKREILTEFNEEWDLSDAEWTSMVFGLGYYEGSQTAHSTHARNPKYPITCGNAVLGYTYTEPDAAFLSKAYRK